MFPEHIDRIFDAYGVPADTKAALFDLYISLGDEVLDVFSDIAERVASPSLLRPEDTYEIRETVVRRYLARNHPRWVEGAPTPSLWHPRVTEGRASGLAMPLGPMSEGSRRAVGDDQPLPDGVVMLGRNAHYGGRQETVSFDVVAASLDDAIAIATSAGQQHTMPGSVGETSGTFDAVHDVALIWEIQPNVYKPAGERNRAIAKLYRRHRNWHLVTLAAAFEWLAGQGCELYVLRGAALAPAHEVNPEKPVSEAIASHHERTVTRVALALGKTLHDVTDSDGLVLLDSDVLNHALRRYVLQHGAHGLFWRVA
jgi:hypothetical protein